MDEKYQHILPKAVLVENGKKYYWCGCGKSENQPFCDRLNCGENCVEFLADLTEEVYFCNCKETKRRPLCDGSHAKLLLEMIKSRSSG